MKKIDKLVFGSFIGPFLLTLIVVDFILLLVTLLKYFDQIMGKGLSLSVFGELIFYFSVSSSPDAFPLAVLLSAIMTFGNLGEHSELTAVKSSGISLVRSLLPIFVFVLMLTGFTYYSNTQLVPKINLKTYSLLWDMRTKKPALDIKEGVFYDGIPGYSIKVNEKVGDEQLKDIIIYDHVGNNGTGNRNVILADSGLMYSFMNQRYLALELFNGIRYEEAYKEKYQDRVDGGQFKRDEFDKNKIVFDLSSFDMNKTDESLFRRSRLVQTRDDLIVGVDSMQRDFYVGQERMFNDVSNTFRYHFVRKNVIPKELSRKRALYDSLRDARRPPVIESIEEDSLSADLNASNVTEETNTLNTPEGRKLAREEQISSKTTLKGAKLAGFNADAKVKKILRVYTPEENLAKFYATFNDTTKTSNNTKEISALSHGINNSRTMRNLLKNRATSLESLKRDQRKFLVTKNQQVARSLACMIMFLIGAPIGAIIKKGGLGLPVIVSVIFFLIYYILNTTGDKWGKEGVFDPAVAVWISNAILLPFGLFFLRQARNDARLFEADVYHVWWLRIRSFFKRRKELKTA
ncbi:MAG: YjgP/YjgQ family permease [Roseivirga sp.]|nr:YjgP/YjgQ family permease [Roseivirga sp.]